MQVGSDLTSPLFVAILFNTYPIIANLTSSFFVPEDRLNPRRAIGLAVAFAGMAWVFSARTESVLAPNPVVGNALILFAATLLGMRMVYTRQFVLRVPYARAVFWPMVGSLPLFLLGDAAIADGVVRSESTWETWVALAYQGIVVGGAGQLAWVYLLRKHTPRHGHRVLVPDPGQRGGPRGRVLRRTCPCTAGDGTGSGPRGHRSGGKVGAAGQAVRPDRRAAGFGRIAVRRSSSCRRRTPWGRTAQAAGPVGARFRSGPW